MARNASLHAAKEAKNDEFYTRREDIENELSHYAEHFRDKVVYCNCDDPETSEFWQFFRRNFRPWGLKKLMATHYEPDEKNYAYMLEISDDTNGDGVVDWKDEPTITQIPCNGDFRSAYCIELLKEADIVVTNPPFSLFRQYVAQLMEYKKKFLIIGNVNAITYKEIFPLIRDNQIWLGASIHSGDRAFYVPDDYPLNAAGCGIDNETGRKFIRVKGVRWYTNLDYKARHIVLDLRGNYYHGNEDKYPKYDNYDAINVDKVCDIPCDYEPCWFKCPHAAECEYAQKEGAKDAIALCEKEEIEEEKCNGEIGVPITYLDKHSEEQFEIVDADFNLAESMDKIDPYGTYEKGGPAFYINNSKKSVDNDIVNEGQSSEARGQRPEASAIAASTNGLSSGRRKCNGIIGVPITFLDKYCPEQFRIVGYGSGSFGTEIGVSGYRKELICKLKGTVPVKGNLYYVKDNEPITPYKRILVQKM